MRLYVLRAGDIRGDVRQAGHMKGSVQGCAAEMQSALTLR